MEKPLKYQNRKIGSFNMQKDFFQNWYRFLYLVEKDIRIDSSLLQKPSERRSFVFRKMIEEYIRTQWHNYNETDFLQWRRKYEAVKISGKKENNSSD